MIPSLRILVLILNPSAALTAPSIKSLLMADCERDKKFNQGDGRPLDRRTLKGNKNLLTTFHKLDRAG